jgi:transposase
MAANPVQGITQPNLFPEDRLGQVEVVKTSLVKQYEKQKTKPTVKHPGRHPLPDGLRREVIELIPEEDVSALQPIGKAVTEILEYQPGEVFVKRYERPEYIKLSEDGLNGRRVIAPLPALPLPKAIAGPTLLTHLMVSKYVDHQPVYRQLEIFKRQQVNIHFSTVSGWIKEAMELIKPVYDLHCKEVLQTNYLNADETTIKVLDKDKKGTTYQGFYWVYYDTGRELVLFDYQPGRGAIYPRSMLKGFKGYLQTDGYDGYDGFDQIEGITTLNCWAHARRKFYEAGEYDPPNAEIVLSGIQKLYQTEAHIREQHYTPEQIKAYRTEHSVPVLNELHDILKNLLLKTLPQSPMGKAVAYSLRRWDKLCVYTTNGILQIDNTLIENSIRPIAIGRKNYLFAGSHERAQDAAMLYSLFTTCRLHHINPEQWLTHLFENIHGTQKDELHLLLPQNYTAHSIKP